MITLTLKGVVRERDSGTPLPTLSVRALREGASGPETMGSAISDERGEFDVRIEPRGLGTFLEDLPNIYLEVYRDGRKEPMYTTDPLARWAKAGAPELIEILLPGDAFFDPKEVSLALAGEDGAAREEFAVGESVLVRGEGLRPAYAHDLEVYSGEEEMFSSRLLTNARGEIEPTVLWPQLGFDDPHTEARYTPEEALKRWAGSAFTVRLSSSGEEIVTEGFKVAERLPALAISTDREGHILNGFEAEYQPLYLTVRNAGFQGSVRVYLVKRQHDWREGDAFEPATLVDGRMAMWEIDLPDGDQLPPIEIAAAAEVRPGAYDFIVRPLRYGYEEDEALRVLPADLIGGRRTTGVVIREPFSTGKPILGGCVNTLPISGRSVSGAPYFQYADTFTEGEYVYGALDPGIVDPGNLGKMCALYVVKSKSEAEWKVDTSLSHLPGLGGNGAVPRIKVESASASTNKVLLWKTSEIGEYDIVADFGNNSPDAATFVPDSSYDTPLDIIDGYFVAGFRVVEDPGTFVEPGLFAGLWEFNENTLLALNLPGTVTVEDEDNPYAKPGGFSVLTRQLPLRGQVAFPADVAGATDPTTQLSATKPDYPLVVVVHGNGHDYNAYEFLLRHLAKNGFVAASINNQYLSGATSVHGMRGLGRANSFFQHLAVLQAKFKARLQNNVGVMGHSMGGEAVIKIARLNETLGIGNKVNALLALAPSDQFGTEILADPWATPFLVVYGSRDADVTGGAPYSGYTVRQTGFSLYDRTSDADKTMLFVHRATHNGFITQNDYWSLSDSPLPVAVQQAIIQAYATAFFRQWLLGEDKWTGMFTGEWRPPSVEATGASTYVQYRTSGGRTVDDFEGTTPDWQVGTLGGAVSHGGALSANPKESRLFDYRPFRPGLDLQSPHDSNGMGLRWNDLGDRLNWRIPASEKDVSAFSVLSLRVTQKQGSSSNPANQPQDFRVRLRDTANNERAIRVSAFGVVPFPDQRAYAPARLSAMTTVRIPLSAYTIECAGMAKVDLENLEELGLDFSLIPTGEIEIDELEFTD